MKSALWPLPCCDWNLLSTATVKLHTEVFELVLRSYISLVMRPKNVTLLMFIIYLFPFFSSDEMVIILTMSLLMPIKRLNSFKPSTSTV